MPIDVARKLYSSSFVARAGYCVGFAALLTAIGCNSLQNATAEGDTRTISLHHMHTDEDLTITYKVNGRYDDEALKKIDYELRDWRRDETIHMDPRLDRLGLGGAARRGRDRADPGGVRLPVARDQFDAAATLQRSGEIQPAHARQGDGFLYSGRAAGAAARHRLVSAARRRRLLPDLGLAVRASRHRQCPPLARRRGRPDAAPDGGGAEPAYRRRSRRGRQQSSAARSLRQARRCPQRARPGPGAPGPGASPSPPRSTS